MKTLAKNLKVPEIDWLNPVRALALLGILLNHLVEEFASGPWFTHPANDWPDLATRLKNLYPHDLSSPFLSLVQFGGWLGDNCPGVFILVSGVGLTWAALHRSDRVPFSDFIKRRLLRIFPLYITLHFIFLFGSLFIPGSTLTMASPHTLLSLMGLRLASFFYLNPSWWFIWLILQLYVIFPLLYRGLHRMGWKWFLLITYGITFLSRFYGLLFSKSLYFWMMGLFAGTRLAEFTTGMLIALYLKNQYDQNTHLSHWGRIFLGALAIYLIGFISSLFWYSTIVANVLISVGLSGVFLGIWKGVLSKHPALAMITTWIGLQAYTVFLIHQTPMQWTAAFFHGPMHLVAALLVVFLSFPFGWILDRTVNRGLQSIQRWQPQKKLTVLSWLVIGVVIIGLGVIETRVADGVPYRLFALILGLCLTVLAIMEYAYARQKTSLHSWMRWTALFAAFVQLFIFPPHSGKFALMFGGLIALVSLLVHRWIQSKPMAWSMGTAAVLFVGIGLEWSLWMYQPIETERWGEFAALQPHPSRTYSLKPDQITHLRYNQYDYYIRTNSFGLNSPEIAVERPTPSTFRILVLGDAFTMPEGMDYQASYPAQLERLLADQNSSRNVQVINAGVTGYGPLEQYPQLQELGAVFKPDLVIYQFFVNEFEEVSFSREERLHGIGFTDGDESRQAALFKTSQLFAHWRRLPERIKEWMTRKPSHGRYVRSLLSFYRIGDNRYERGENPYYQPENIERLRHTLSAMKRFCDENNAALILYYVPAAVAVSQTKDIFYLPWDQDISDRSVYDFSKPFVELSKITTEWKIPLFDLTAALRASVQQPAYFPDSWHWNQWGHQAAAQAIAKSLQQMGFLKEASNE